MQRYIQQMTVSEIGVAGQQQIATAKVLIIGAGGLGIPVATYLSSAGVGTIGIMDPDSVAVSNLSRQFVYSENEIGLSKAELLVKKLRRQNPTIKVEAYRQMLTDDNAADHISQYDIVCDCTDSVQARIATDKKCAELSKSLVYAVVSAWEGYVMVLHHKKKITLEDVFPYQSLIDNEVLNCSSGGIINTTCGIAGSIQASEVLKIILGLPSELDGGILAFNMYQPVFKIFKLR